jgi:diaminopimelate epimerase
MDYYKYHGLGNDYIVIDPNKFHMDLSPAHAQLICDRHYGIGSDGILFGPVQNESGEIGLRIFNPDGSEAEKSGNGLRIFARYLVDEGYEREKRPFSIGTKGGKVRVCVLDKAERIQVKMGKVTFWNTEIPMVGERREVVNEELMIDDKAIYVTCLSVGNPHCVIPMDEISPTIAKQLGPKIESHKCFPNRINIQLLKVIDRRTIYIEIWERGAGYTLASGSSSCAAAAAAYRLGFIDNQVEVHMPGGRLDIKIHPNGQLELTGPVSAISKGFFEDDLKKKL